MALGRTGRLIVLALGWIFVVLGVLGLFLPILQGVLFLLVGLVLLAQVSPRVRLLRRRLRRRFPAVSARLDAAEATARRWLGRLGVIIRGRAGRGPGKR